MKSALTQPRKKGVRIAKSQARKAAKKNGAANAPAPKVQRLEKTETKSEITTA